MSTLDDVSVCDLVGDVAIRSIGDVARLYARDGGMVYLASPYSWRGQPADRARRIERDRTRAAGRVACRLVALEVTVYAPTVFGHYTEECGDERLHWSMWMLHCLALLRRAHAMLVLTLPGWTDSVGLRTEVIEARAAGLPVARLSLDPAFYSGLDLGTS